MNNAIFQEIMNQNFTEKFWHELNHESDVHVEFVDAAVCYTALRQLTYGETVMDMPRA